MAGLGAGAGAGAALLGAWPLGGFLYVPFDGGLGGGAARSRLRCSRAFQAALTLSCCPRTWRQLPGISDVQLTSAISTPSTMLDSTARTVLAWFPVGLSSRKRIMRHPARSWSQRTSTMRPSYSSPVSFILHVSYLPD